MRSGKNILCFTFLSFCLFWLSCNQKNSSKSVYGQWKVVSLNFDSTSSIYKEMNAEERHDTKAIATGFVFDFKKDNTFIITHRQGETSRGTFKITGKDEILMSPEGNEVQPGQILYLDKTTFELKDHKRGYIFVLRKI